MGTEATVSATDSIQKHPSHGGFNRYAIAQTNVEVSTQNVSIQMETHSF